MNGVAGAATTIDRGGRRLALLAILAVAFATRLVAFGNPVANIDDQFYLLVGHDWWRGQIPYLDIWDRKPPGLFLLYALLAKIGGGSILVVQIAASLFAAGTAWLIRAVALRFAGPRAALFAALSYLFMIPLLGGQTGQSPVFYNLFMAGAALLLFRSVEGDATIGRAAPWAMLLCGLSMAIKQVAFVEGAYFGLAFLFLLRRAGQSWGSLGKAAALMIVVALAPTVIGILSFALAGPGALQTVVHANFVSIFLKAPAGVEGKLVGIALFLVYALPLLLFAMFGYRKLRREQPDRLARKLLTGWLVAAVGGWVIVPNFFDHYALPLLVPLAVLAAPFFDRAIGHLYFAALAIACLAQGIILDWSNNRDARVWFNRLAATSDAARRGGCLFLADGPTALYQAVPSCRLTRYLFPYHLVLQTERNAVGVDTTAELRRVLARRPAVVLTQESERAKHGSAVNALLDDTLRQDYRPIFTVPANAPPTVATLSVWQRRDLAPPEQR
jgi:4-amino-4-deoxy-L-arabinose transferase-like glycosyltransferase